MSDEQETAAKSTIRNLVVVAPPGCGKTELLAHRAEELISRLGPNQQILALTFSKKARDNLSTRIREHLGVRRARKYVVVRNFHGFAAELVRAHCRTIGLEPEFELPAKDLLTASLSKSTPGWDEVVAARDIVSNAKRRPVDDDQLLRNLRVIGNVDAIQAELDRVDAGAIHYEDLLRHAQRLLRVRGVAHLFRQHYGAILVDEFQDLTLQQLDIALRVCDNSRTFVGDPLQGIFSFAGARPLEVEKVLNRIAGAKPLQLSVSFRSSPAVLQMLNGISEPLGAEPLYAAHPEVWPDGGASSAVEFNTDGDEAHWVVGFAKQVLLRKPDSSVGVIARSGWRRLILDKAFDNVRSDIAVSQWDLAVDDPDAVARFQAALELMPKSATVDDVLGKVIADISSRDVEAVTNARLVAEDLQRRLKIGGTLRSLVKELARPNLERSVTPGVHLLNAHTGKGQQFDWVVVPGLQDGHIPDFHAVTEAKKQEEHRALLVILSRARLGVVTTYAHRATGKSGNPYNTRPSEWWEVLSRSATMDAPTFIKYVRDGAWPGHGPSGGLV